MSDPRLGSADALGTSRLRDRIETALGRFGRHVYRHAWPTIAGFALAVAALLTQLPNVQLDASTETLLEPDDPNRVAYDEFRAIFGPDKAILIAVETDDVFDLDFLEKLRRLHRDLEDEVPYIDEVTSLVNARDTRGEADRLVVGELLEEMPASEAELAQLRERALSNPAYIDQIVSKDARTATIIVRPDVYSSAGQDASGLGGFGDADEAAEENEAAALEYLTPEENQELCRVTDEVVARHRAAGLTIYTAGMPMMTDRLMRIMAQDMGRFTGLALLTITATLALLLRRVTAVVLPLLVSVLAMLSTLSIMAISGIALTTVTQIMPSFLLAVGVGSSVHILVIFYQALGRGDSKEDGVVHALEHSGLAVIMTALTTAGGLLSFISASIAPVRDLGIITPIGIMAALVFSLVLTPALLAVMPLHGAVDKGARRGAATREALARWGEFATNRPWTMVAIWAVVLAQAFVGISRVGFSHDPVRWFPRDDPFRIAMERMNDRLGGLSFLEAVIDTHEEDGLRTPEMMNHLEAMAEIAASERRGRIRLGKSLSVVDVVKETHQALNENRPDHYSIPQDRRLLSQELLLFENAGTDELENLVDPQFSMGRLSMKLPLVDAIYYVDYIEQLDRGFQAHVGEDAEVTITGFSQVMMTITHRLGESIIRTYILAFVIITPLMMLLLGSVRVGLLSMVPNLAPIVITVGLMGWLGIPLEIFTLLIGSIALGLAVDDTVHFMHNYRRYYEQSGDEHFATRQTLTTTGQALLFTSLVLSSGFFIYSQASLVNLAHFGILTGVTIILAFLADLLLAPALMTLVARYSARRRARVTGAEAAV